MKPILFLFAFFLALGFFLLASSFLRLPTIATQKAMLAAGRQTRAKARASDTLLRGLAVRISKFVRMDEYKRSRLAKVLAASGLSDTPELYISTAVVKALTVGLAIIPALWLLPLLAPVLLLLAIMIYFKEIHKADELLAVKREQIEQVLPRFVATITQELKASRDVLTMLQHFRRHAGEKFAEELDVLVADMRSSNYEAALTRFEARINSPLLSDVVRGLIGVLRGDDSAMYFQMLSHDMKQLELQRLKAKALKIPPKIRVFSLVMLLCFLLTYITIIVYQIITSLTVMF